MATIWPQAGNDALGGVALRSLWSGRPGRDYLSDALAQLEGWTHEGKQIRRTLALDDAQHAELTERIKVVADALRLRPDIRRLDGHTQIHIGSPNGGKITEGEVTLAARIEDAYRTIVEPAASTGTPPASTPASHRGTTER